MPNKERFWLLEVSYGYEDTNLDGGASPSNNNQDSNPETTPVAQDPATSNEVDGAAQANPAGAPATNLPFQDILTSAQQDQLNAHIASLVEQALARISQIKFGLKFVSLIHMECT